MGDSHFRVTPDAPKAALWVFLSAHVEPDNLTVSDGLSPYPGAIERI